MLVDGFGPKIDLIADKLKLGLLKYVVKESNLSPKIVLTFHYKSLKLVF